MKTAWIAAMLQSRMRPHEDQLSVEQAQFLSIYVCSDVNMILRRREWIVVVGNVSIQAKIHGS